MSQAAVHEISHKTERGQTAPEKVTSETRVAVLTGCQDRPYAFGLTIALAAAGVSVEVVGSDEVDSPEFHTTPGVTFTQPPRSATPTRSLLQISISLGASYVRLISYAATSRSSGHSCPLEQ